MLPMIMLPMRMAPSQMESTMEETYTVLRSLMVKFVCTSCGRPHGVSANTDENRNSSLQPIGPGVSSRAGSLAATPAAISVGPPTMKKPPISTAIMPMAIMAPCTTSV